jgi:hypothetical protein
MQNRIAVLLVVLSKEVKIEYLLQNLKALYSYIENHIIH